MKAFKLKLEAHILSCAARILARSESVVVAVVGSVGKTGTKDAVALALSAFGQVRSSPKSYNSDIGVALTVLGYSSPWSNPFAWLWIALKATFLSLFAVCDERYIVLEVGSDRPGDIARLVHKLKVDAVVCTTWGATPVHMEFFGSAAELVREDLAIIGALKQGGVVIANTDDIWVGLVGEIAHKHGARVVTYGAQIDSNAVISSNKIAYEADGRPTGMDVEVTLGQMIHSVRVDGSLGFQWASPIAAALATVHALDLAVYEAALKLNQFSSQPGRMKILDGINGSILLDDTYNSSPIAAEAALRMLTQVEGKGMSIAVLGDMRELGAVSNSEHARIGALCAELGVDRIFAIGDYAKVLCDAAVKAGMSEAAVSTYQFVEDAIPSLVLLPKEDDVVLLKGSQGIRVEKATKELLKDPTTAPALLVRQDEVWRNR